VKSVNATCCLFCHLRGEADGSTLADRITQRCAPPHFEKKCPDPAHADSCQRCRLREWESRRPTSMPVNPRSHPPWGHASGPDPPSTNRPWGRASGPDPPPPAAKAAAGAGHREDKRAGMGSRTGYSAATTMPAPAACLSVMPH